MDDASFNVFSYTFYIFDGLHMFSCQPGHKSHVDIRRVT